MAQRRSLGMSGVCGAQSNVIVPNHANANANDTVCSPAPNAVALLVDKLIAPLLSTPAVQDQ